MRSAEQIADEARVACKADIACYDDCYGRPCRQIVNAIRAAQREASDLAILKAASVAYDMGDYRIGGRISAIKLPGDAP